LGKRKSSKKPQAKIKLKLEKEFTCLQCNTEESIHVKIDKDNQVGHLECKKCGVTFQSKTNYLTEPIDVYSDWVDA
ncbi:transcription elongation factor 1, partial [Obelidium mucronatum]